MRKLYYLILVSMVVVLNLKFTKAQNNEEPSFWDKNINLIPPFQFQQQSQNRGVYDPLVHYLQYDPLWGANQLGDCVDATIEDQGCAITSVAMVLSSFGANANPATLNTWLKNNGGYADGCELDWYKIDDYPPQLISYNGKTLNYSLSTMKQYIDLGNIIIAGIGSHYYVISGYENDGNSEYDYLVYDANLSEAPSIWGDYSYWGCYVLHFYNVGILYSKSEFSASQTTIYASQSVTFTDLSTNNPTSWFWDLEGSNTTTSTLQNPTVTYSQPGTYSVSLLATNNKGRDVETKPYYITVLPISANFSANSTNIIAGNSISFTDETIGATSWLWSFPGGTPSNSTIQNPTVIYNTQGTYNVTLTATNSYGSDFEVKNNYITVNPQAPVANFTYDPSNPYVNDIVNFEDKSTNSPESWSWNFGDGYTSTSQNPTHIYVNTGSYSVSLKATNATDNHTFTKVINVTHPGILVSGRVISDSYVGLSGIPISTNLGSSTLSGYNGNFTITVPYNTPFILYIDGGQQYTSPVPVSYTYSQNTNIGDIMLWPITLFIQKTLVSGTYYKFSAENAPIGTTDYNWFLNGVSKQNGSNRFYYYYSECNTTFTIGLQVTGSGTYNAANISVSVPTCPNVTSGVAYDVNNQCSTVRVGQEVTITDISYPFNAIDKLNVWWEDGSGENWCISASCASTPENSVYAANCKEFTHTFNTSGHYAAAVTAFNSVGNSTGTDYVGFNVVDCDVTVETYHLTNSIKDYWNDTYSFWAGSFNISDFIPFSSTGLSVHPGYNIKVGACNEIILRPGVTIAPLPGKTVELFIDDCLQPNNSSKNYEMIDTYTSFEDYCVGEMLQKAVEVNKKEEKTNSEYKILIFPNPNNGKFFIDISNNDYTITRMEIYNSLGQLMMEKLNVNKNRYNVDISTQPYGFYYLKVYSQQKIETFKIIYTTNQ